MEERRDSLSIKKYLLDLNIPWNNYTETIVNQITYLLDNQEPKLNEVLYKKKKIPSLKETSTPKNIYTLYNINFTFEIDSSVEDMVLKNFQHLTLNKHHNNYLYNFKITQTDTLYSISVNNKEIQKDIEKEQLLGFLQDLIRITIYENSNLFVAFHSAILSYEDKPLIFPALSGSGKSTLSAFLMQKEGFKFYSDEVTAIDKEYLIKPLPLSIVLKQGSWSVLKGLSKEIKEAIPYKRFDSQDIKYITPQQVATKSLNAKDALMIFPNYKKDATLELKSLTLVESIGLLVESGYHLDKREDFSCVKSYLTYLSKLKIYQLTYSNLENAHKKIKELLHEHS